MHLAIRLLTPALSLSVVVLCGCGGSPDKGIDIVGKLVKDGTPVAVELTPAKAAPPGESTRIRVVLYPVKSETDAIVDGSGEVIAIGAEQATVENNATFRIATGPGVKGGKFRVVVTHVDPSTGIDVLKGQFNEVNSKITRDVTPGKEVVIDLGKPTG